MKQKLIALCILAINIFCIIKGEPLISIILAPAWLTLLFSKRNWLYY